MFRQIIALLGLISLEKSEAGSDLLLFLQGKRIDHDDDY